MLDSKTTTAYKLYLSKMEKYNIDYKNIIDGVSLIKKICEIDSQKGGKLDRGGVKMYLSAILWYNKTNNINNDEMIHLKNEIKNITNEYIEKYDENKLSENERDVYLEWNDIEKVYNKLYEDRKKNYKSFRDCIIIGLYVLFPPRRIMDYSKMVVKKYSEELNDEENYYIMDYKMFIFNSFKEKDTCEKIFYISDEMSLLLNEYIDSFDLYDKKLLNMKEKELSEKVKRIMKKYTNKCASVNTFRHSYISYMEKNGFLKTTKLKKELASKMGHSHRTQQDIYRKNQPDDSSLSE